MQHRIKKCRACGATVESGSIKCNSCHSSLKKSRSTFFSKKKKALIAFFDRLLDVRIKTK
jgi:uncharacterized paraquat-inducible protein A